MTMKRKSPPATKADLKALQKSTKADIAELRKSTKADLSAAITELRENTQAEFAKVNTRIDCLDERTRRMAAEIVRNTDRIERVETNLRQDMRALGEDVRGRLDAFTARFETIWRESITFPKMLDEQGATLRAHEQRLSALEARPAL